MQPFIFGHRGAMAYEPENTLRSFKKAIDLGVDGIELDVKRCKSGEIVVIHDEKVDRTTNGIGYVRDLTLSQLKKLDAGKSQTIPTLEEVIDFIKKINHNRKQIKLIIELKEKGMEEDVVNIVEKNNFTNKVIVISFYHKLVENIKKTNKKIKTGILFVENPVSISNLVQFLSIDYIFPNFNYVDEDLVENAHKNKIKVFVWNVDDVENLQKMLKLQVDGMGSNKSGRVINYLKIKKT